MRSHLISKLLVLSLFILCQVSFTSLHAQNNSTPTDTAEVEKPKPISLLDLSSETEKIREVVSLAESRMVSDERIRQIDSAYTVFSNAVDNDKADYVEFRKVTPNRQKLDNMIHEWNSYSTRLNSWQSSLNGYQARNTSTIAVLEKDLASWQLTAAAAIESGVPESVSASIKKSNDDLEAVIARLKAQNNLVLTIETRIVEQKHDINVVVRDLENWIQSGELNLLYRRHEPLWQTDFARTEEDKSRRGDNNIKEKLSKIAEFATIYENKIHYYAIYLALIIALVFFLKKRLSTLELSGSQTHLARTKEIISHNAWSTIFFIFFLIEVVFLDNLPEILIGLCTIGILLTAMRLFRPFALRQFRWIILFIALGYLLDTLKSYFWFTSANYRVYLLLEAFFGLAVVYYAIRITKKIGESSLSKIGGMLYKMLPLLIVGLVLAIISNVLGYTNLTDLLLKICSQGAVITTIAYGILMVLGGIVSALIILHFERKKTYNVAYKAYLLKRASRLVYIFAIVFWVGFFLTSAEVYRPMMSALQLWLSEPWVFGKTSITPQNILSFITVLFFTFIITRFIATIVRGGALNSFNLPRGVPNAVSLVIRYLIIVFGIVLSLGSLGVDLTGFSLMAGALGVGIGFGLQNIISNFVAGIILTFERPIQSGDTIEVGTVFGVVQKIGVRSSSVRSFDGADIAVPNNTLLSNDLINWTQSDVKKRMDIRIGTAYGSDPNEVLKILKSIANDSKYTVKDPSPMALFDEFGESSLNFRLLMWVPVDDILSAKSDVSIEIYNRFKEAHIVIPFPQRDINIITQTEEE